MTPINLIKHEHRVNDSPTQSTFGIPTDTASITNDRPLTGMSVSSSYMDWSRPRNQSEEFALNIARKLEKIPPGNLRRQLEISIEMEILNTEKIAIEESILQ